MPTSLSACLSLRQYMGSQCSVNILLPVDIAELFHSEGPNPRRMTLHPWDTHRETRKHSKGVFLKLVSVCYVHLSVCMCNDFGDVCIYCYEVCVTVWICINVCVMCACVCTVMCNAFLLMCVSVKKWSWMALWPVAVEPWGNVEFSRTTFHTVVGWGGTGFYSCPEA